MSVGNLCCDEEDFIRNVPGPARSDSQCHSWENVGVVSLAREEGLSTGQGNLWEWTPTCKYSPALIKDKKKKSIPIRKRSLIFLLLIITCAQGDTGDRVAKPQSAEACPPKPPPVDTLGGPTPPEPRSGPWKGYQALSTCLYCKCSDLAEESFYLSINHLWGMKGDSCRTKVWGCVIALAIGGGEGKGKNE